MESDKKDEDSSSLDQRVMYAAGIAALLLPVQCHGEDLNWTFLS